MQEPNTPTYRKKQTAQLVMAALSDLRANNGVTVKRMVSHISEQYAVPESDFVKYIPAVLERGMAFGTIREKNGKYCLGEVMKCWSESTKKNTKKAKKKCDERLLETVIEKLKEKELEDDNVKDESKEPSNSSSTILVM